MSCGTFGLGLPTSVLTVVFATLCAERLHKTQVVPHTGRTATKGEVRRTHCDYNGIPRRVWTPSFFVPFGCPDWNGLHDLLGRFSFFLLPSIWTRVEGARTRGTGPLRCGHLRGLFLRSREVPLKYWGTTFWEALSEPERNASLSVEHAIEPD